jgi:hypothetical protein
VILARCYADGHEPSGITEVEEFLDKLGKVLYIMTLRIAKII